MAKLGLEGTDAAFGASLAFRSTPSVTDPELSDDLGARAPVNGKIGDAGATSVLKQPHHVWRLLQPGLIQVNAGPHGAW